MSRLDKDNMLRFLQSYDVLKHKYFWDMDSVPADVVQKSILLNRRCTVTDTAWNIQKATNTYLTVKDVYHDDMKGYLGALQLALEKFVFDFVGIDGINQLFESSYFYFEWMMHLEYSPEKHDYVRYRDHYVHQVKNMYEMLTLLDELEYMGYCIKAFQEGSSLVANQVRASIEEQIQTIGPQEKKLFRVLKKAKYGTEAKDKVWRKRMREHYYRYLIHAVSVVAALTHDIGYPITYALRTVGQLHSFLPLSEAFLHLNDAMPHLEEILQESLLYRTVEPAQIAERIRVKEDHGAISAVILLSKYYETGAIYHLKPIERMVVELSAVVVYDHTVKYTYVTGKKGQAYRPLFEDNPLSYLFRLCDDVQEWGRVYFDISQKSNFLVCPRCHLPITRDNASKMMSYVCGCGLSALRRTRFPYRKMTNIAACRAVEICKAKTDGAETSTQVRPRLTMKVEYDLISLLQLALYNPGFARYRAEGIYEVKRMLDGQKAIPDIYVTTFLTNNPIAIKVKCLERFLESCGRELWRVGPEVGLPGDVAQENRRRWAVLDETSWPLVLTYEDVECLVDAAAVIQEVCKKAGWPYGSKRRSWVNTKQKWMENLRFYQFLSVLGAHVEACRRSGAFSERTKAISFAGELADCISAQYGIWDRYTTVLIRDYVWQRIRNVAEDEFFQGRANEYYEEAMLSNQAMTNAIEEYVDSVAYERVREELGKKDPGSLEGIYDFYTDYELFSVMAQD